MARRWSTSDIPDLSGRTAVVTGANSGLGKATARELARRGARVVMACRSRDRAEEAQADLLRDVPGADLPVEILDLARLADVEAFAERFADAYDRLDLLYCNAGIMAVPRGETEDGFEMQFGVNVLGHFALIGRLLPVLLDTEGSRVVTLSSLAAWSGKIYFDDLNLERSYGRWKAYNQSKLADLMLALELDRRLQEQGATTKALAAHPGLSNTDLQTTSVEKNGSKAEELFYSLTMDRIAQSAAQGAEPQLRAGTDPLARGGAFYGPKYWMRGPAVEANPPRAALDAGARVRLWETCERLTGTSVLSG
jgi:NAD(P)-dependent dehydrogenase (short-subunit alcohol dehydrogenase family)